MKKILSLFLGLLWALPVWGANCNLFDISQSPTTENISSNLIWTRYNINVSSTSLSVGNWTAKHTDFISPGTYTITFNGTNSSVAIRGYDGSNLSVLRRGNGSFTITNPTQIWIFVADPETMARITEIMLEQGSTATPYQPYNPNCGCNGTIVNYVSATGTGVQNGTPTPTNPIEPTFYKQGNMILRKVGDIADSYDATTGKITRRVGVKVLDGTEDWVKPSGSARYGVILNDSSPSENLIPISSHFVGLSANTSWNQMYSGSCKKEKTTSRYYFQYDTITTIQDWEQYLAEQYAAGTPVTVWYPLAEETTEDWPASYCETPIKIATTKYNETKFSPLNTALANAISVVDSVVSNTITQAASIATLQAQKQTRPNDIADDNEKCPAGKKCLLVEDASGVPHWYEIVESYSRLPEGFTELQYIQSSGSQYIDTGVKGNMGVKFDVDFAVSDSSVTNFIVASRAQSGADTRFYLCTFFNSGHGVFDIALGDDEFAGTVQNNTRYTAVMDTNVAPSTLVISDGTTLSSSGNYNTDLNLYVFASNTAGTANFGGKKPITIYKLKIYENNTLVRDFVPAKNADGKIGMYDLANGVFYENAGEGSFIAGDPVAE